MNPVEISRRLPLGPGIRVLDWNEDGLVALDKPAGILSHPNEAKDGKRSLLDAPYDYEGEFFAWKDRGGEGRVWLLNRLDSPTSGVILVALEKDLAESIKREFAGRNVTKTYYAICKSTVASSSGIWNDDLKQSVYRNGRLIKDGPPVSAKTRYRVLKTTTSGLGLSLIRLVPLTGRTHQLRIQCRKHGRPIVGDRTYGDFHFNREVAAVTGVNRLWLHSYGIDVRYGYQGKKRRFQVESSLPEAFDEVMCLRAVRPAARSSVKKKEPQKNSKKKSVLENRRFRVG